MGGNGLLLVGLVSSYRHDRELVDFNLAKFEAAKLHEAIEKKQLDHDDVVWILTTKNFFQLRATFVCYKQSYEVAIDQV
ncbi:Annexin D3 [Vitis vinifera]|uniref:Annexin D3 n=1 Tax=Vitis vinifera TaxID=29760 RepID=A0A438BLQ9_VITVI|nr:Annexin D3 [Vitis vinifera]RVW58651.1 Annexin D3 [Vitis vinifera]